MPTLTADELAILRYRPVGSRYRFYVYQPATVWTGRIEPGSAPSTGDRELEVETVSGDPASILAGMTCRVTTEYGDLKAAPSKVRIKGYAGGTLTLADNAIDWSERDILVAVRLWEIWPRVPYIDQDDGTQYKDRDIAWVSDDQAQPPKANAGPAAIAHLDEQGYADAVFQDEGSFACPGGGAVSAYQWTAIGGSPTVVAGGEATSTVTYRYTAAGYYYVRLTVTDGNGQTGFVMVPVIIDDGTLGAAYEVPGDRRWDNFGWVLSRRVLGLAAAEDDARWYDGAPCFLVSLAEQPYYYGGCTANPATSYAFSLGLGQSLTVEYNTFVAYVDIEVTGGTAPGAITLRRGRDVAGAQVFSLTGGTALVGVDAGWVRYEPDEPVPLSPGQYTLVPGTDGDGFWQYVTAEGCYEGGDPYRSGAWWPGADFSFRLFLYDRPPVTGAFAAGRCNLRWSGWLSGDSLRVSSDEREVGFEAVSTAHVLANVPAFPQGFRSDASPANWYEYTDLSIDSVAYLLLVWHSTVSWVADYHPTGEWTARPRPGENCRADDLLAQVDDVLAAAMAELRCDRQGVLRATRREWFSSDGERALRDTVMTLAKADFLSADCGPHEHRPRFREARVSGVDGNSNPYLAGSPGESPLDGGRPTEEQNLAPKSQAELDQWAWQYLASVNHPEMVRLRMAGEYDVVDPALGEFVEGGPVSYYDPRIDRGPYSVAGVSIQEDSEGLVTLAEWTLQPYPTRYASQTVPIPDPPAPPDPPDPGDGTGLPDLPDITLVKAIVGTVGPASLGDPTEGAGVQAGTYSGGTWTWANCNTGFGGSGTPIVEDVVVDPNNQSRAACIARTETDDKAAVWVNDDWIGGSGSWAKCTTVTDDEIAKALETLIGETVSWVDLVHLYAYAVSDTETKLVCVVYYRCDDETPAGALDNNRFTRCIVSGDWGEHWDDIGDRMVGTDGLGTTYSYAFGNASARGNSGDLDGYEKVGALIYRNGILYAAAMAAKSGGANRHTNLCYSVDHAATWNKLVNSDSAFQGIVCGCALRASGTGLYTSAWPTYVSPDLEAHLYYTAEIVPDDADPESGGYDFDELHSTDVSDWSIDASYYAFARDMLVVTPADGDHLSILIGASETGGTKIYIGADGSAVGVPPVTIHATYNYRVLIQHPADDDCLLLGRSYEVSELASAGDAESECIFKWTDDQFSTVSDASGGLYAAGVRGITAGVIVAL